MVFVLSVFGNDFFPLLSIYTRSLSLDNVDLGTYNIKKWLTPLWKIYLSWIYVRMPFFFLLLSLAWLRRCYLSPNRHTIKISFSSVFFRYQHVNLYRRFVFGMKWKSVDEKPRYTISDDLLHRIEIKHTTVLPSRGFYYQIRDELNDSLKSFWRAIITLSLFLKTIRIQNGTNNGGPFSLEPKNETIIMKMAILSTNCSMPMRLWRNMKMKTNKNHLNTLTNRDKKKKKKPNKKLAPENDYGKKMSLGKMDEVGEEVGQKSLSMELQKGLRGQENQRHQRMVLENSTKTMRQSTNWKHEQRHVCMQKIEHNKRTKK